MNGSIVKPSDSRYHLLSSPVPVTDEDTAVKNELNVLFLNNLVLRDKEEAVQSQEDKDYPFTLVSYKTSLHTQSRSIRHAHRLELFPENFVLMHTDDAMRLRLKAMDAVRLTSRHHPEGVVPKLHVSPATAPGSTPMRCRGSTLICATPRSWTWSQASPISAIPVSKWSKFNRDWAQTMRPIHPKFLLD
jgi:anaerobic selenocysteine-containing dehydrogenase